MSWSRFKKKIANVKNRFAYSQRVVVSNIWIGALSVLEKHRKMRGWGWGIRRRRGANRQRSKCGVSQNGLVKYTQSDILHCIHITSTVLGGSAAGHFDRAGSVHRRCAPSTLLGMMIPYRLSCLSHRSRHVIACPHTFWMFFRNRQHCHNFTNSIIRRNCILLSHNSFHNVFVRTYQHIRTFIHLSILVRFFSLFSSHLWQNVVC